MRLAEKMQIVSGVVPVDLSTGANDGDWVSLKNYDHLTIIIFKGAGTAGQDPTLTMEQATDVAGTGAKALTFTDIYSKVGTQTGIAQFTKSVQTAAATFVDLTSAESEAIIVVEFDAEDLDVTNSFDCVRARIADVGANAQLGSILYLLSGARHATEPMPGAIVD